MNAAHNPIKNLARLSLHRLGGLQALFWYHRSSFQILTYHRFSDIQGIDTVNVLRRQFSYIRKHFHPVSLSQIQRALNGQATLPPKAVAITVDDGYRDFLSVAFPLFQEYQLPVTVYLISDFIDGRLWPWWDQLEYALQRTTKPYFENGLAGENQHRPLPLRSDAERQSAYAALCAALTRVPNHTRLAVLEHLPQTLAVELPKPAPPQYAALTWDEVRMLKNSGVEFGGHSTTHPILTALEDAQSVYAEVAESKRRIEEELQCPVIHFAYPNGDFNETIVAAVKRCGFLSAATVLSGSCSTSTDPYLLKRRSIELDFSDDYFREMLAGVH